MKEAHIELDFDFGSDGNLDGFDPWKVWQFIETNKIKCSYKSFKEIHDIFIKAEKEGELVVDNSGEALYYFICDKESHEGSTNQKVI